ncbi:hypothetical protein BC628DRAFT_1420085 [Trametes gibbosa]|nr:hypothetical protein BC628DRAFT_1420085 [Trametes gibbosa]
MADPPSATQRMPSFDNTLGAILLGSVFGFMLYGLMAHQAYRYYRMYPADRPLLKCLVSAVMSTLSLSETFHTVLWIIVCYEYLVVNFANVANVAKTYWYLKTIFPATAITMLLCQVFYANRIYQVGPHWRYKLIVGVAVLFMAMHFSWAMVAAVKSYLAKDLKQFAASTLYVSISYGHAIVVDIIFASALVSVLRNSHTGFKRTDTVLDSLIKYTVTTGVLTTFFEILIFTFGLLYPDNYIYAAITIPGVKLYSNSMLAMLNCRQALSDRMMQDIESSSLRLAPRTPPRAASHTLLFKPQGSHETPVSFSTVVDISLTSGTNGRDYETSSVGEEDKPAQVVAEGPMISGEHSYDRTMTYA